MTEKKVTEKKPDVDAMPTKGFFINMLTKDIDLVDAIIDLVDNSVDGARRYGKGKSYKGMWIKVETTTDYFLIEDNCGGIPLEVAENYAFRFGRDDKWEPMKHSVGQFGVGMKRALFKMGELIKVDSRTTTTQFKLTIPVAKWRNTNVWGFDFDEKPSKKRLELPHTGTSIRVTQLYDGVKTEFDDSRFKTRLQNELQSKHYQSVNNGLKITVNGNDLVGSKLELTISDVIRPMRTKFEIGTGADEIDVEIICGVKDDGDKNPAKAGWYVYCNGRAIIEADRSFTTGWGDGGGKGIPHYHNQFSTFRGYVFMEADKGALLPWNTTKTGVEMSSEVYQRVRDRMVKAARPVIDFLNALDREKENAEVSKKPLTDATQSAERKPIDTIPERASFVYPKSEAKKAAKDKRITYVVSSKDFERVRKSLRVENAKEVGEGTFYHYVREVVE